MKLNLGERIMVLQEREGIDDTELGKMVYEDPKHRVRKPLKHSNVRIAKIKNNLCIPTRAELNRIAEVLGVGIKDLLEDDFTVTEYVVLDEKAMKMFPNLEPFIRMINLSVAMGQKEMAEDTIRKMPKLLLENKVDVVEPGPKPEPKPVQLNLNKVPAKKPKGKK